MLTGQELGAAIEAARIKKGVTKKALAEHFQVTPPSIQDWVKRGTIDKGKLVELWAYFADVVGPEHWGLPWRTETQPAAPLPAAPPSAAEPAPPFRNPVTLAQALPLVADALAALPAVRWPSVRAQLDQLVQSPEMRDEVLAELQALLATAPGKQHRKAA